MTKKLKSLTNISYRVIGNFYGKGIVFLATTLVARKVGPENFGHIKIVLSLFSIFLIFSGSQITRAIATYTTQFPNERKKLFLIGIEFIIICYVISLILFYLFLNMFNIITDTFALSIFFIYLPIIIFFILANSFKALLQGANDIIRMTTFDIIHGTIKGIVIIVFVWTLGMNGWLKGRIIGDITACILLLLLTIPFFKKYFKNQDFSQDKKWFRKYLVYYGWSFSGSGLITLQNNIDTFLLLWFVKDISQIAYLGVARLFLSSLGIFGISITSALHAKIAILYEDKQQLLKHLIMTQKFTNLLFIFALLILYIFAPGIIITLFGQDYQPSILLFRIILIAALFQNISFINGGYWLAIGNVKLSTKFSFFSFIFYIIISILLIIHFQVIGLAIAIVLSKLFNAIYSSILSRVK